jgi:hypothetical protein
MKIDIRHGDITLNREKLPAGIELEPATRALKLAGDSGPHMLKHVPGMKYAQQGSTFFILLPSDSVLSHPTTHHDAQLAANVAGEVWVSRKLIESRGDDDAAVED